MVADLSMLTEIVVCPTVRDGDGLALSSRNAYLTPQERSEAVAVSRAVFEARDLILAGERDPAALQAAMLEKLGAASAATIQYAEVVDTTTIAPVTVIKPGEELLAAVAVFFGETRLIDNQFVTAPV